MEEPYTLYIKTHQGKYYKPVIKGAIKVKTEAPIGASKIEFNVIKDETISYNEGDAVILLVNGEPFFYGYIFSKSRSKEQIIKTTAWDQLRYLKNKDTYQYEDSTCSQLLHLICDDRLLEKGEIEESEYVIKGRIEQDKEYFDMLQMALNLTVTHEGNLYTIYDEAGKVCMKSPKSMQVDTPVTYDNTIDFDYKTDIENAANKVKIKKSDNTYHIEEDEEKRARWGILQYYAESDEADEVIEEKAKQVLELLCKTNRSLSIKRTKGNPKLRAGGLVPVIFMAIGDINIQSMMYAQSVEHIFDEAGYHWMNLKVYNKDIMPQATAQGAFKTKKQQTSGGGYGGASSGIAGTRGAFIDYALAQLGKRYSQPERFAPDAFDCSSLVLRATREAGLDTTGANLTTYTMPTDPRYYEVPRSEMQPGDILWNYEHVAIYLGGDQTVEARGKAYGVCYANVGNRFDRVYRVRGMD